MSSKTTTETDSTEFSGSNNGIVDESDVFGQQFLENDLRVENEDIDARHAFLLTSDAAGDRGQLLQVFQGIENEVQEFYGYNLRQWADKDREGHEIPDGAQSHYVAWRQIDPTEIVSEEQPTDLFDDDMYKLREYYTDDYNIEMSIELEELEAYIWEKADTEEDIFNALNAYQRIADGDTDDTSVREIVPPDNPDNESELQQSSAAFFWSHIVGTPVLKLELDENGMYQPLGQVEYDWIDADNKDKGVKRID